jgi:hypothetical protein
MLCIGTNQTRSNRIFKFSRGNVHDDVSINISGLWMLLVGLKFGGGEYLLSEWYTS